MFKETFNKAYFIITVLVLFITSPLVSQNIVDSTSNSDSLINQTNISFQKLTGQILDKNSGEPVQYASVKLSNTKFATTANKFGLFSIKIPIELSWDTLWVSSMGYQTIGIKLKGKKSTILNIHLQRESFASSQLKTYIDELNARIVVQKAIKAIPDNYDMGGFSASFYIRDYLSINEKAYQNTEFAGDLIHFNTLDSLGFRRYYNERKINVKIPERPIIHGIYDKFMHSGNPFIHYPVFYPKNQSNFIFKQDKIIKFNDRDIIRISFKAKNTDFSNIRTLYANAFYGNLFIDADNFAIVKIVINIDYDPKELADNELRMAMRRNIPITDFRNFSHNEFSEKFLFIFQQKKNGLYYNVYNIGTLLIDDTDLETDINYTYKRLYNDLIYGYKQGKKNMPADYKMDWFNPEIPYNPEFWNNFVTPVGDEIMELEEQN